MKINNLSKQHCMRKVIALSIMVFVSAMVSAQNSQLIQSFGNNLYQWSTTGDINYLINAQAVCGKGKKALVKNNMARSLAKKNNVPFDKSIRIETFFGWLQSEIYDNGAIISLSDIKTYNASDYATKVQPGYDIVVGTMTVKSNKSYASNSKEENTFYIEKGKIVKIEHCERLANGKIKLDFSDFNDQDLSWGLLYNYSQHMPYGAGAFISWKFLMFGIDMGFVNKIKDEDEIKIRRLASMTDILNYKVEESSYTPDGFITFTPSFYYKYFSVGCGFGGLLMSGTKSTIVYKSVSSNSEFSSSQYQTRTFENVSSKRKFKFMIRPNVKGYIPIADNWSIVVSAGYDYCFGYKNLNGFNFGIGFQHRLDND